MKTRTVFKVRPAALDDLPAITDIYNLATHTIANFDTEKTLQNRVEWYLDHGARLPVLVAECDGLVIGWGSLSSWSDQLPYADTCEVEIYIRKFHQGVGIGKELLAQLIATARRHKLQTILARVTNGLTPAATLLEKAGFQRAATMQAVARKFGTLHDVHVYQLQVSSESK